MFRLSGAGNDFLALAEPQEEPSAERIRAWCSRGTSLGADGLFVLRRAAPGVRMTYYNADGGEADLCLNGTRCAVRLAFQLGWAQDEVEIRTGAGPVRGRMAGASRVAAEVPPPDSAPRELTLTAVGRAWRVWFLRVGVPHVVLFWDRDLTDAPLAELGPPLRRHADLGPAGANVSLVAVESPQRFAIRTWERGVEAETLACGTGVLAATAAGLASKRLQAPVTALTRGGFELAIDADADGGRVTRWSLAGDARLVARLEVTDEAEALPPRPAWE